MLLWRIATWTSTLPPSLTWLGLSGPLWGGNRCEACSGISELYICITEFWRCRSLRIPLHSWRISLSDLKNEGAAIEDGEDLNCAIRSHEGCQGKRVEAPQPPGQSSMVQFIQTTGSIIIVMEYGCQIQSWPLQPSCPHTSLPSEYGPLALAMTITSLLSLCRRELRR